MIIILGSICPYDYVDGGVVNLPLFPEDNAVMIKVNWCKENNIKVTLTTLDNFEYLSKEIVFHATFEHQDQRLTEYLLKFS